MGLRLVRQAVCDKPRCDMRVFMGDQQSHSEQALEDGWTFDEEKAEWHCPECSVTTCSAAEAAREARRA